MENENEQIITIPLTSDIDPADLLDIIIEMKDDIIERIEMQGAEVVIEEDEISVSIV